jgi:hypothetical protein
VRRRLSSGGRRPDCHGSTTPAVPQAYFLSARPVNPAPGAFKTPECLKIRVGAGGMAIASLHRKASGERAVSSPRCFAASASPSPSMAKRNRPSGSFRSISCRAFSRAANGAGSKRPRAARRALNAFCTISTGAGVLRAGVVPSDLILPQSGISGRRWRAARSARRLCAHIAGIDIVRVDADDFYVLEDNARTPSGVSYMLENREAMMRLFPSCSPASRRAGGELSRRPAGDAALGGAALGAGASRPVVLLTPGSSIRPITSTRSSPTRSASSWSRAAISSCATTSSTCARPRGRSAST